jgi:hypothetical protein
MYKVHPHSALFIVALVGTAGCSGATLLSGSTTTQTSSAQSGSLAILARPPFVHLGVPMPPDVHHSGSVRGSIRPDYQYNQRLVFESDQTETAVNVYKASALPLNPSPFATIHVQAGCPYGLAMDQAGKLYVLDNCGGNDIEEYPPGQTTPSVTITNGVTSPEGAAMDQNQTLYVSNYSPTSIKEYPYGATSPSQTISGQGLVEPLGLATDHNGNLYAADFGASQVFKIPFGTTNVIPLNLQNLVEPLAVAVDHKSGNLWVTDGQGDKVNVYHPGSTTPFEMITGFTYPYAISIEKKGSHRGTVVISDVDTDMFWAYHPAQYTPYASVTNGIQDPTGLLIEKP